MWGCLIYAIVLPIIQATLSSDCYNQFCTYGYLEDSKLAFEQMGQNHNIIWESLGIIVSIACFNATGVAITKYASAPQRSTVDTSRTLVIWIVSLFLKLEFFVKWISLGQIAAFGILVFGTLVYNEIYVIPIDCLSKNTKKNIEKRDGVLDNVENLDYIATSPTAKYDANRNKRSLRASGADTRKSGSRRSDLINKH